MPKETAMKTIPTLIMITALMAAELPVFSQTCNNESVQFTETFGQGQGSTSLPAGRTNYNYNGSSSLSDGDYELHRNSQSRPEWHESSDHTGNYRGRMMITNASYTPGEFYRDTVYGLSAASTFNVYLYAMNVNTVGTCSPNPILPRLQLIVESYNSNGTFTQIASIISDDLPQTQNPTWVRISGLFNLPAGVTSVRYRILNNATGGCGNDVAIDDITFSQCAYTILPVRGMSLRAHNEGSSVELSWSTVQEINTDRFVVEKSADGVNWSTVTSVKAAGNSNSRKEYAAADQAPFSPMCFYRVVAIDFDGKKTYSNSVVVKPSAMVGQLTAYPNPFAASINVKVDVSEARSASLRIFSISGRAIRQMPWQLKKGTNTNVIADLQNVSAGLYFVDVVDQYGAVLYRTKMLKQ